MNIREARQQVGMTQRQLGENTGIDQAVISRMENGRQSITLDQLRNIAKALGVPPCDLLDESETH